MLNRFNNGYILNDQKIQQKYFKCFFFQVLLLIFFIVTQYLVHIEID